MTNTYKGLHVDHVKKTNNINIHEVSLRVAFYGTFDMTNGETIHQAIGCSKDQLAILEKLAKIHLHREILYRKSSLRLHLEYSIKHLHFICYNQHTKLVNFFSQNLQRISKLVNVH